jgi:limonene 1,2-monooxygenase
MSDYPEVKFGAFIGPYHPVKTDSNYAMHYDMELIEHLDRLGYHEVWVGEHHSAGSELSAFWAVITGAVIAIFCDDLLPFEM